MGKTTGVEEGRKLEGKVRGSQGGSKRQGPNRGSKKIKFGL